MAEPGSSKLTRRAWLTASACAGVEVGLLATAAALSACDDSTTGAHIQLATRVTGEIPSSGVVSNALGWQVTLLRARLALGDLLYLDGAALTRRGPSEWLLPRAHAHPGHYRQGVVLGEMHKPTLVDLLAGPQLLGVNDGITGLARSATLGFFEAAAGLDGVAGAVALLEGRAEREGDLARHFVAYATTAQVLASATQLPEVSGCTIDDGDFAADGEVTLSVQLREWVDQIDFSEVTASDTQPIELTAVQPPHNAFIRGVKKTTSYAFRYRMGGSV